MGLFSRRRPSSSGGADRQRSAIAAFWSWWESGGSAETAVAIADRDPGRVVTAISRRVDAIHPGLGWELGAGSVSEHVLVVSSEGDPELRSVARRWRQGAPVPDETWEYSDARLPVPDPEGLVMTLDDVPIDVASVTVAARVEGAQLDVAIHHPSFAGLDEGPRTTAAFILLDQVLGEAAVEMWIGAVSAITVPPLDPVPLTGLTSVVRDLVEEYTDDDGRPAWVLMRGEAPDGRPVLAGAQVPLSAATAPEFDTHVAVDVAFPEVVAADGDESGLPGPDSLRALHALEEHLGRRLGGSGRLVARETHGGHHVLHAYVDGTTPAVEQLRVAVAGWDAGRVRVESRPDPSWEQVAHLRP